MALFAKTTEEAKPAATKEPVATKKVALKESPLAARILKRPRITEKAYALNVLNQYVFVVTKEATKTIVKQAIEEAYGVTVTSVNIVKLPAKKRLSGKARTPGFRSAIKKAIVTLAKGQTIELFKAGV